MKNTKILFLGLLLILGSCAYKSETDKKNQMYYSIDSLIEENVRYLTLNKAKLTKNTMDSLVGAVSYSPDSAEWEQELALFRSVDINKPALSHAYEISVQDDRNSNLDVLKYVGKGDLFVQEMRIYYLKQLSEIKKIEAFTFRDNVIYFSKSKLVMNFTRYNGHIVLSDYSIVAYQKLAGRDTIATSIHGIIEIMD